MVQGLIVEGGVKQNLYLEGGRGNEEGKLVDACLSCPGTPRGEGDMERFDPCLAGLHRQVQKYPGASRSM